MAKRTIIQVIHSGSLSLIALCNDGTLWINKFDGWGWQLLPDVVPQPDEDIKK